MGVFAQLLPKVRQIDRTELSRSTQCCACSDRLRFSPNAVVIEVRAGNGDGYYFCNLEHAWEWFKDHQRYL